ncbi:cation:proton antiporter [bacterium]|nr:cation:proton antiporter [bacterium]
MEGHGPAILSELALLFMIALAAALIIRSLRLPTIVGYLLAGIIAGPFAFGLLHDTSQIRDLSELGVVLLLFSIGLEISPSRLWELRREALIGGTIQVVGTAALAGGLAVAFGLPLPVAAAIGFFISLSSTAVALRLLGDDGQLDSPHGRFALAVLLLQDLAVVPITLAIPLLAGQESGAGAIGLLLLKTVGLIALVLILARRIVPWLLDRVAARRSRELFLLSVAAIVLATAWLTTFAGLSPALGAFLAGLVISETEHRHLALAEAAPFRELFLAVFFLSIGMLLDLGALIAAPWLPLLMTVVVYLGKGAIVGGLARLFGRTPAQALRAGAYLGQVGEFSFVILLIASSTGLIGEALMQPLVATAALTLLATPFASKGAEKLAARLAARHPEPVEQLGAEHKEEAGHVLIIGYGLGGRSIAKVLRALGVPYRISEMNPVTVQQEKANGEPILLGDASRPEVLEALGIHHAKAAVVAINDPHTLRPIIQVLKREAPGITVLVRTRFASDLEELHRLGADVAIPEELETSLQVVGTLLRRLGFPGETIRRHLDELRQEGYRLAPSTIPWAHSVQELDAIELRSVILEEQDPAIGKTLVDMNLRQETGATVVTVIRERSSLLDPAHAVLEVGDRLVLTGTEDALISASNLLRHGKAVENAAQHDESASPQ